MLSRRADLSATARLSCLVCPVLNALLKRSFRRWNRITYPRCFMSSTGCGSWIGSGSGYVFWWTAAFTAPRRHYLADSLRRIADVHGRRRLRSSVSDTLVAAPTNRSTLGDRAFPVVALRAWNGLPSSVRAASPLSTFRQELKTFLFRTSLQWLIPRPVAHLFYIFYIQRACWIFVNNVKLSATSLHSLRIFHLNIIRSLLTTLLSVY